MFSLKVDCSVSLEISVTYCLNVIKSILATVCNVRHKSAVQHRVLTDAEGQMSQLLTEIYQ